MLMSEYLKLPLEHIVKHMRRSVVLHLYWWSRHTQSATYLMMEKASVMLVNGSMFLEFKGVNLVCVCGE
jgi:hypothetical protein